MIRTNAQRIVTARLALTAASWARCGQDHPGEAVTDLLTDLRHFCAARGISFEVCSGSASARFEAEIDEGAI